MIKVEKKNQREFTVKVEEKEYDVGTYRSTWEPLSTYVPEDEVTKNLSLPL